MILPVSVDSKAIQEFREIYKQTFDIEIGPEESQKMANDLLVFFKFLFEKPLKNEDLNKYLYENNISKKTTN